MPSRRLVQRRGRHSSVERGAIDPGSWRTAPAVADAEEEDVEEAVAADAEASPALVAAAPDPAPPAEVELRPKIAIDWPRLEAGGCLGPERADPDLTRTLRQIGARLEARAFAPAAHRRARLVLVSSPTGGEGKSFSALNLALSLALDGRKVMLVDTDPRGRGAAGTLGLIGQPGLSEALAADLPPGPVLGHATDLATLEVLGPGTGDLGALASPQMATLTRALLAAEPARLILIDGPSLLTGPTAAVLAALAGQTLLVVRAGETKEAAIGQALGTLRGHADVALLLNRPPLPNPREAHVAQSTASRLEALAPWRGLWRWSRVRRGG